ncbi:Hypothetical predicted protein [Octopus vulgaris]|uniref:Immunoglobulin domain-containing protein n=1 Tax=Octopus vulgaris TaxID=6645 RepID=A0AA36FKU9_OCTVU|nr:Hypothetical predicted protein [Octopus vulgaris]
MKLLFIITLRPSDNSVSGDYMSLFISPTAGLDIRGITKVALICSYNVPKLTTFELFAKTKSVVKMSFQTNKKTANKLIHKRDGFDCTLIVASKGDIICWKINSTCKDEGPYRCATDKKSSKPKILTVKSAIDKLEVIDIPVLIDETVTFRCTANVTKTYKSVDVGNYGSRENYVHFNWLVSNAPPKTTTAKPTTTERPTTTEKITTTVTTTTAKPIPKIKFAWRRRPKSNADMKLFIAPSTGLDIRGITKVALICSYDVPELTTFELFAKSKSLVKMSFQTNKKTANKLIHKRDGFDCTLIVASKGDIICWKINSTCKDEGPYRCATDKKSSKPTVLTVKSAIHNLEVIDIPVSIDETVTFRCTANVTKTYKSVDVGNYGSRENYVTFNWLVSNVPPKTTTAKPTTTEKITTTVTTTTTTAKPTTTTAKPIPKIIFWWRRRPKSNADMKLFIAPSTGLDIRGITKVALICSYDVPELTTFELFAKTKSLVKMSFQTNKKTANKLIHKRDGFDCTLIVASKGDIICWKINSTCKDEGPYRCATDKKSSKPTVLTVKSAIHNLEVIDIPVSIDETVTFRCTANVTKTYKSVDVGNYGSRENYVTFNWLVSNVPPKTTTAKPTTTEKITTTVTTTTTAKPTTTEKPTTTAKPNMKLFIAPSTGLDIRGITKVALICSYDVPELTTFELFAKTKSLVKMSFQTNKKTANKLIHKRDGFDCTLIVASKGDIICWKINSTCKDEGPYRCATDKKSSKPTVLTVKSAIHNLEVIDIPVSIDETVTFRCTANVTKTYKSVDVGNYGSRENYVTFNWLVSNVPPKTTTAKPTTTEKITTTVTTTTTAKPTTTEKPTTTAKPTTTEKPTTTTAKPIPKIIFWWRRRPKSNADMSLFISPTAGLDIRGITKVALICSYNVPELTTFELFAKTKSVVKMSYQTNKKTANKLLYKRDGFDCTLIVASKGDIICWKINSTCDDEGPYRCATDKESSKPKILTVKSAIDKLEVIDIPVLIDETVTFRCTANVTKTYKSVDVGNYGSRENYVHFNWLVSNGKNTVQANKKILVPSDIDCFVPATSKYQYKVTSADLLNKTTVKCSIFGETLTKPLYAKAPPKTTTAKPTTTEKLTTTVTTTTTAKPTTTTAKPTTTKPPLTVDSLPKIKWAWRRRSKSNAVYYAIHRLLLFIRLLSFTSSNRPIVKDSLELTIPSFRT